MRETAASRSASKRSPATDLADVPPIEETYGYGEAKSHALALIAAVGEYRRGERSWASIEGRNIVLTGTPGTGKTVFARSLAKSLGVNLTATSVSAWFSQTGGYLNEICKKIDEVFLEASQTGGVLLIDECDSIPNRETCDSRHRDYWVPMVSHILTTLDGATSSPASRLIIVGATNLVTRLDPALTRPGRLDRIVHIGLPDEAAIQGILRQHLRGDLADTDLSPIALVGAGATGAEIAGWAAGARMTARAARRPMLLADLLGRIAPPDRRPPGSQLSVARHEAAHATATEALLVGSVKAVSLVADGTAAGRTTCRLRDAENRTAKDIDDIVVSILAGRAADERWGTVTTGSAGGPGSDLAIATRLVAGKHGTWGLGTSLLHRGDQIDALLHVRSDPAFRQVVEDDLSRLYRIARDVVERHAPAIDRLARRLVSARVLGGDEVRGIIGLADACVEEGGAVVVVGGPHG